MKPPILFSVSNVYTRMAGGDEEAQEYVQKATTYEITYWGRQGTRSYASGRRGFASAKKTRLVRFGGPGWFLTGWALIIKQALERRGYTVSMVDRRVKPELEFQWPAPKLAPYPYQEEAADACVEAGRGILEIPTGGGKTLIAAWIIQRLGVKTLYVVPNKLLLDQVSKDLRKDFGEDQVGYIGSGTFDVRNITVSTVQTLWARRDKEEVQKLLAEVNCMIIDECHVVGSVRDYGTQYYKSVQKTSGVTRDRLGNMWYEIARYCGAYYRFGLSATPGERKEIDGGVLRGVTGGMLMKLTASKLIDEGYLAAPEVFMYYVDNECRNASRMDLVDYQEMYKTNILENQERNRLIADLCGAYARSGKTVLVTVSRVEHGKRIIELMQQQPHLDESEYAFVYGSTNKAERQEAIERFIQKDVKVLVGTVFKMGFNVKNLDVILLADAGRKQQNTEQRVGRVLRYFHGKRAIVIDFVDDDDSVSLQHSLWRLRYYLSEPAFTVNLVGFDAEEMMKRKPFIFEGNLTRKGESSICVLDVEAAQSIPGAGKEDYKINAKIVNVGEVKV